ncbi:MAG: hypothetical protein H6754_05085 [Candidatus Omnitrophica bacterium]|nr:hypothetical protein [Candidatus Omnitrophota bacterium]
MKKIIGLIVAGLLISSSQVFAHCGKCGVGDAHPESDVSAMVTKKSDMLAKELKLSDEQKTKVQAILKEKMDKKAKIMDEKHAAMTSLHEEFKAKLGTVLTPEQMKNWEAMMDKSSEKGVKCPMCKDGKMCKMCQLKKADK